MIRIKSIWFKQQEGRKFNRPGFSAAPIVCENGIWTTALFRFSERQMRWEREPLAKPGDITWLNA